MPKTFRLILGLFFASVFFHGTSYGLDAGDSPPANATLVYVGTFTDTPSGSKGIYRFWLRTDASSGKAALMPLGLAAETSNPSFLALDAKRHLLFAVNEINSFQGKPGGAVSSFAIDPATGRLTLINQRSSMGLGPCHLALDKTGKNLLVANYASGSVAVLPVGADGRIGEPTCVLQDTGKGPNPNRQEGPHAHCVALSPDNRFAFVCDLGIDKVMIYKLDAERGKLIPNDPPFVQLKPGVGPRHIVFSPNGRFAYVICELASSISAFAYDDQRGAFTELQTLSSLGANNQKPNTAAEIAIAPSGKFLFASNRGNNTVVAFAIDSQTGSLRLIGEQSTGGNTPRYFGIDPSGRQLAVCNQQSDTVLMCGIDPVSGLLKSSDVFARVPAPVCAVFLPSPSSKTESGQ
jgi:6-phosphogluconolactonase